MEMEDKKIDTAAEQALPVQELPADIPAEVRQKLAEDLNEEATEDLKQDMREAEKEEANDEEVKANPEMLTKSRLLKLLIKKQYVKLREVTEEEQPADLAELLEELDENNRLVVFRLLKKEVATEAFAYMSDEARDDLVNAFSDVELVSAIEEMSLDDAADLLEDMPAGVVKRVLEKSSKQTRESLNKLLNYPESSAGSLMTPEYVRLREDMTVAQAFEAIRKQGENAETVYTCYVVERNRLKGVVSARSLLLSEPHTPINEIMDDNVVTVKVTDDQEYVAREMQRYDFTAMPVLDNEGMFVGIITIDDAIDVLTDESTEDMQKMAAILPADEATTYFGTSVWTHAKQRIPWLLILMLSATFTGMVTTHYEEAFVSLPLLVSFMPMLMDTAGNCGNQISTLMVRGLALGEVEPSDFVKVLGKELRVSAIVGAVLGIVNGLRIYLMYTFLFPGQYQNVMGYAIVVSVSLFFSVILAKLVGGMLPLAAKKLGADPAIMATPFITTIVDACSLIPLAGGGAGGGLNDPLCALKIMVQGRMGFCIALLYHLVVAAAALADLVLFSGSGAGSRHHDPITHVVVQGRDEIIFFCCRAADPEKVIRTLVKGISLLCASRGNRFFFLPAMLMSFQQGSLVCSPILVLLCHFPVLGQFRQGSGLVGPGGFPVLGQLRQCSSFVSLGLGIDIGFVSLRVGFLLLGLGCRGLHLVGVRRQHGSRRGQGKANGQHQSGHTSAQFVDFSHVPSSFNCCRVSGFACRP